MQEYGPLVCGFFLFGKLFVFLSACLFLLPAMMARHENPGSAVNQRQLVVEARRNLFRYFTSRLRFLAFFACVHALVTSGDSPQTNTVSMVMSRHKKIHYSELWERRYSSQPRTEIANAVIEKFRPMPFTGNPMILSPLMIPLSSCNVPSHGD